MHEIDFWATLWGHQEQQKFYLKVLTQRNFAAEFH